MSATDPGRSPSRHDNRIETIVASIRKVFGDDAILVAQRQVDVAEAESRDDWVAILEHLRG